MVANLINRMIARTGPECAVMFNVIVNTHTKHILHIIETNKGGKRKAHTHTPPWEDQCEWHRMTRMTGPDCAVMCNFINTHTHTHTHIIWSTVIPEKAAPVTGNTLRTTGTVPADSRQ